MERSSAVPPVGIGHGLGGRRAAVRVDGVVGCGLVEPIVEGVEQRVVQACAWVVTLLCPLPRTFHAQPSAGLRQEERMIWP